MSAFNNALFIKRKKIHGTETADSHDVATIPKRYDPERTQSCHLEPHGTSTTRGVGVEAFWEMLEKRCPILSFSGFGRFKIVIRKIRFPRFLSAVNEEKKASVS